MTAIEGTTLRNEDNAPWSGLQTQFMERRLEKRAYGFKHQRRYWRCLTRCLHCSRLTLRSTQCR